ncbi:DUF3103 family protein [Streptomyces sp. CB03911]|uniref:DUF3103 family protein n=1 Tax=Streptomyces sp. CB03911 TaxID=1804758 RepID=UPI00093E6183|nr:DUF3103 family protein [Streptomyces sp. CB03911]OKI17493.1 hypothetical protein A6A07_39980 [Streptomyces sp. CB03911]
MSRSRTRRGTLAAVAAVALLTITAGPATASPAPAAPPAKSAEVTRIEEQVARDLARSLADPAWRARLRAGADAGTAQLAPLASGSSAPAARGLAAGVADADRRIAAAKGLGTEPGPLLQVQLADPSMRVALDAGVAPLVAAATADDHARTITAYDTAGRPHLLETKEIPNRPVYLVDLDSARTTAAGLRVLAAELARQGLGLPAARPAAPAAAAAGWWATKIDAVEVKDDEEPWFKGDAEMFALVTGFGLDGKVRVDSVDMPYLNNDGTVYRPNQILVNWSNYKYNLADVVLMEDDGDTNYQALATAIAAVLLTIADQGAYIPLVNAVLSAVPASWWTDDPDYVDSWYTLARTSSGRLDGAAANGWLSVSPYFVEQF